MAQVKHFKARRDVVLDCGHKVRSGEAFVVTSFFCCDEDGRWLQAVARSTLRAAVTKLHEEMERLGLAGKAAEQR